MLKLERVSKYYFAGNQVVQALRRVSLEVGIGEFVAITGESGSGKSTLLNVMSGLDTYEEGVVFFEGRDLSHYSVEELERYRKDAIGYVFQEFNIVEGYTVLENVESALIVQGYAAAERRKRALALIERVGLTPAARRQAGRLSGGEKQRTVIARTLAKDYRVLMCDEPTGNLNEAAARGIFQLLRDISRDHLVVVVTHDARLADEFATRRIRLYDGEIVEDAQLVEKQPYASAPAQVRPSKPHFGGLLRLGLKNVLAAPKKTLLTLLTFLFLFTTALFVYGAGAIEKNRAVAVTNPFFANPFPGRIVLVKDDASPFAPEETAVLEAIPDVLAVFANDVVFDSLFMTKHFNEERMVFEFTYYRPLPAAVLVAADLTSGRLPETAGEVVIEEDGHSVLGGELAIANAHLLPERQSLETDQFTFVIVGFVAADAEDIDGLYLTTTGLDALAATSVFAHSDVEIRIEGTEEHEMPSDTWITPEDDPGVDVGIRSYAVNFPIWVGVDPDLDDGEILVFDMLFFDVCRDFGYKKATRDDADAGLCDADAFIASHAFRMRANTAYDSDNEFLPITVISVAATDNDQSMKLYMNEATYLAYFGEADHQLTVVVKDVFEGKRVVKELVQLGYDPYYPALILGPAQAVELLIRNILVTVIVAVILFVLFFLGYVVLRNLVFGKFRDYLILRSLGVSRRGIRTVLGAEIYGAATVAALPIVVFLAFAGSRIPLVATFLRYLLWYDYLIVAGIFLAILAVMVFELSRKVFAAGVVAALKGAVR